MTTRQQQLTDKTAHKGCILRLVFIETWRTALLAEQQDMYSTIAMLMHLIELLAHATTYMRLMHKPSRTLRGSAKRIYGQGWQCSPQLFGRTQVLTVKIASAKAAGVSCGKLCPAATCRCSWRAKNLSFWCTVPPGFKGSARPSRVTAGTLTPGWPARRSSSFCSAGSPAQEPMLCL